MANSQQEWLKDLSLINTTMRRIATQKYPNSSYVDLTTSEVTNKAAYNLSQCSFHTRAIALWFEQLSCNGISDVVLTKILRDLTGRNTYGAFSELAAYGILAENKLKFDAQVSMPGTAILNPNGSDLDGKLILNNHILFDVKAFGTQKYLVDQIVTKLNKSFPNEQVFAEGDFDVSIGLLEDLLSLSYKQLRDDLKSSPKISRQSIDFVRVPVQSVLSFATTGNPYALAKENADYPFKYSKQFPKWQPFILIFVVHPWLGGLNNHVNFCDFTDIYFRALARRFFMQFKCDREKVMGVTKAFASRLLSGIFFVNAWQGNSDSELSRLYLNPNAAHPLTELDTTILTSSMSNILVDDFEFDNY